MVYPNNCERYQRPPGPFRFNSAVRGRGGWNNAPAAGGGLMPPPYHVSEPPSWQRPPDPNYRPPVIPNPCTRPPILGSHPSQAVGVAGNMTHCPVPTGAVPAPHPILPPPPSHLPPPVSGPPPYHPTPVAPVLPYTDTRSSRPPGQDTTPPDVSANPQEQQAPAERYPPQYSGGYYSSVTSTQEDRRNYSPAPVPQDSHRMPYPPRDNTSARPEPYSVNDFPRHEPAARENSWESAPMRPVERLREERPREERRGDYSDNYRGRHGDRYFRMERYERDRQTDSRRSSPGIGIRDQRNESSGRYSKSDRRSPSRHSPRRNRRETDKGRSRTPREERPRESRERERVRETSRIPRSSPDRDRGRETERTSRSSQLKRKLSPEEQSSRSPSKRSRIKQNERSPSPEPELSSIDLAFLENLPEDLLEIKTEKEDEEGAEEEKKSETKTEEPSPPAWIRCSPADLYFRINRENATVTSTKRLEALADRFKSDLLERAQKVRASKPPTIKRERPPPARVIHGHTHCQCHPSDSDDSSCDEVSAYLEEADQWLEELQRKKDHPERLHEELWFNEPGEMNDGPLCRCSATARKTGLRHLVYPGEQPFPKCDLDSNNLDKLYHYRITMSPYNNFLSNNPTIIEHDNHEYIFEGFSLFTHYKLTKIPVCRLIRFNIEYTIHWFEEDAPENFSIRTLNHFCDYLFDEVLELYDLKWLEEAEGCCRRFHFMPRFVRDLPDNGKEILSMNEVLNYLLRSSKNLIDESLLPDLADYTQDEWHSLVDTVRGMIVTFPGMRPSSLRVDQIDREELKPGESNHPKIIHFGIRPAQLSYAGDPSYQKLWKQYVKFKYLISNKPKVTSEDKYKLRNKEDKLQAIRVKAMTCHAMQSHEQVCDNLPKDHLAATLHPHMSQFSIERSMKREVTIEQSCAGYLRTGIKSDVCQHALLIPVLIEHLRFHKCLDVLEERLQYKFKDRLFIQYAMTHPSYRVNYGTNPDHARNSLSNCGKRQLEYGNRYVHYMHTRKRGINTLINIMSQLGKHQETSSDISHYERLEFLGDAVVEFLATVNLFYMFPQLEEGGMATYRAALVQNQHLAMLGMKLRLQDFMLYAHGPDLCRESEVRHAVANCFEALMGALFLDAGIEEAGRVFGLCLFEDRPELHAVWTAMPPHPLKEDEPNGDRHWIPLSPLLQKLTKFEDAIGVKFTHVRLLAKAFTLRNVGYNHLTMGHNQRLEFLGDTVLQLVASNFLFKHFPNHHEGHLSLLRSSLVNNRTQAIVCDDLGMVPYAISAEGSRPIGQLEMRNYKEKADILEAFMGALYVDQGLENCRVFSEVCFFPRLKIFIMNQDWNDPKSQLQQCCLTLRDLNDTEPDIPTYKVLESIGPTNTRKYMVAVYFRGRRMATGVGHSIQQAEMDAAANGLRDKGQIFPHFQYQRDFLNKKFKKKKPGSQREETDTNPQFSERSKDKDSPRNMSRNRDRDSERSRDRDRGRNRDRDIDRDSSRKDRRSRYTDRRR